MAFELFLVDKKEVVFIPLVRRKKKTLLPGKKKGNFSWCLKFSGKKPMVCQDHIFVMSRAKLQKLPRLLFVFHGNFFSYFVTGNWSIFNGKIWRFLSRALFAKSRALFQEVPRANWKLSRKKKHCPLPHACTHKQSNSWIIWEHITNF